MRLTRRGFVKFSAGSALGIGLSGASLKIMGDLTQAMAQEIYPPRGPESFSNSICRLCPGGCGVRVRKIGERVVRVMGNESSPINQGGLCPVGVALPQYLYHPERLKVPLKRQGDSWGEIPWDRALSEIASQLQASTTGNDSPGVMVLSHPLTGVLRRAVSALLKGLGSNNLLELTGPREGNTVAVRLMQGVVREPAYDLAKSNYVLSLGCEVLEDWSSPVWAMKGYGQFRGKRPRGRLTYVGPRQSVTASKADQWVQIPVGGEALFALGIAYVLISERLYDFEFVDSHCSGFEDWRDEQGRLRQGFRNLVLERYPLNRVSELTGVSPQQILRVAREFGNARPALALSGPVESLTSSALVGALCTHSLNALVGSIDREGGILLQRPSPLDPMDSDPEDTVPDFLRDFKNRVHLGEDPLQTFELALRESRREALPSALLMLEVDPLFDSSSPENLRRHLEQIPLLVSVSSFLNPTSQVADYVLPAATALESWLELSAPPGVWFSYEQLAPPAVEPAGESRSCGDIVLDLSRALGQAVPEGDYGEQVQNHASRLYGLRRGAVAGTVFDRLWHQLMEQSGWWAPTYETPVQLLQQMESKGGWWDSFYRYEDWQRILGTPSGKFRFHVPEIQFPEDSDFLGETFFYRPQAGGAERIEGTQYPFQVVFFNPLVAVSRQTALPLIREIAGGHAQNTLGLWVELGEKDAHLLGIKRGDRIRVESPHNAIVAVARVNARVPQGMVHIPKRIRSPKNGFWETASASGVNGLVEEAHHLSPPLWLDTRVRIARL